MLKSYLPLVVLLTCFLLFKLTNMGIRMSDTNIYFYTAYQMLEGHTLYKDIFFTNFPLFPYISIIYFFLSFKQLPLYFLTSSIEASIIAWILYYLSLKHTKSVLISTLTSSMYLFSFIVLSTSDHQTGVFTASLFAVISYTCMHKKNYILTGIFITCAVLTKAYFLPILISIGLYLFITNKKALILVALTSIFSALVILLPTLIFARDQFIEQVFNYSLTRSQGIEKNNILWFFITHDFLLFITFLLSLLYIKKYLFFFLASVTGMLFILLYQDLYFLYLNFLIPFLCLFFMYVYNDIISKLSIQKMVIPSVILLFLIYNVIVYQINFRSMQTIPNIENIVKTIMSVNPTVLYGVNDTTPALAYLTNKPLLNSITDTNENIFRKKYLNATKLTNDAIQQNALFISHGVSYPASGIEQTIVNGIFDVQTIAKHKCKVVGSFPVISEGIVNKLNLISCASE